jgi:phospholipid/cholesterol/gamma-HCH transport system substrate-binding protein
LQWAKIRISVVTVSALSILGVLVYLLSGGTWLKPKTYLFTYVPDSSGLAPGSDVLLNGVAIGQVEWLRLTRSKDPTRVVEVRLKIQENFLRHIPEDSVTSVDSENLLGDKYMDITMGNSPRPVRSGGELQFQPPTSLLKNIDLEQFGAQLKLIDRIVRDAQEGKGSLGEFVTKEDLYRGVLGQIADVERALRAASDTHSRVGQFLYGAATYTDIRMSLRQLDDRLAQLQASPYLRDSTQYDEIHERIDQVRRTLADLNAGKGTGGKLLSSDEAYAAWNRKLAAWIESIDALDYGEGGMGRLLATSQSYESLDGALRGLRDTLKEFRESPQKFLRIKIF